MCGVRGPESGVDTIRNRAGAGRRGTEAADEGFYHDGTTGTKGKQALYSSIQ